MGGDVTGLSERDPAGGVDQRELLSLLLGITLELLALLRDLMLDLSADINRRPVYRVGLTARANGAATAAKPIVNASYSSDRRAHRRRRL